MNTESNALLEFFLCSSHLAQVRRTGWVWENIENPETIAEHCFRVMFFAWVLGSKAELGQHKTISMALVHELCEVYAGDMTPYFGILPEEEQEKQKVLQRWIRLPQKKKEVLSRKKFDIEKEGFEKAVSPLSNALQQRLTALWMEYEKGLSAEGKFVKQIDRIEALLQGIEYMGPKPNSVLVGWWEGTEEIVDHPLLREFLKTIENRLYYGKASDMDGELAFLIETGRLKRKERRGWIIRGVKDPETMGNHVFMHSLMAWIFSWEVGRALNRDRILKMCLLNLLGYARIKEQSPFDPLLKQAKTGEEKQKILAKWTRSLMQGKERANKERREKERDSLREITSTLSPILQEEMLSCHQEYVENKTPESRLVHQTYVLEILLRAFQYLQEDPSFAIKPWWEWASEVVDDPIFTDFMNAMDKKFSS